MKVHEITFSGELSGRVLRMKPGASRNSIHVLYKTGQDTESLFLSEIVSEDNDYMIACRIQELADGFRGTHGDVAVYRHMLDYFVK